ncbi:UDP-glucuronosyltransferase 1A1-like isoform X5 [Hemicordylus capensis]|uniref:UDP-glucuronosyltransferase 1A1-like isoform X5 n=1 Tax=Hemicordylus capensis TaxID=884348 RepID=UPI002302439A|nr:UDP-glucuronosyltransferase 1A1-like isoform X5 [Hemicordylus capensis]
MGFLHSFHVGFNHCATSKKTSLGQGIYQLSARLFLMVVFWKLLDGGKVLVVPGDNSHWLSMHLVVERLHQKGHQIVVVAPDVNLLMKPSVHCMMKTFAVPYTKEYLNAEFVTLGHKSFTYQPFLAKMTETFTRLRAIRTVFSTNCEQLLYNKELVSYLEENTFDVVFMDPLSPCGQILAAYLSVPSVYYLRGMPCGFDFKVTQCPNPPSYIPKFFTGNTDHMTFNQRVKNFLVSSLEFMFCYIFYSPYEFLIREFLHQDMTVSELYSQASIWLLRYDFVFEYPRPIMPNMVFVGGINCARKNLLTQVLWRYTGEAPPNLAKNTKLVKWLPQNDLLAHPKARAFITHAGSHGIYEGICNGVPMVLMPLFGDQMDNAKRVESRGAGVTLNVVEMTSKDLSDALKAVIYDKQYKENIMHLSALHLDRPIHPLDLAVHWVEFVMKHKGAPHLRPAAHDLNWIQYHSLDVIAFLMAIALLALFISVKCCLFCCRKCFCKRGRLSKKGKSKSQ